MNSQAFTGGELVTIPRSGSTMATVVAKVKDEENLVAEIWFHVKVLDGSPDGISYGPYPPDITRRPGWYEKDLVLHSLYPTEVSTVLLGDQGIVLASTIESFCVRTAGAGGPGEVRVQDEDTPAAVASTLVFQGKVLSVNASGTAALDLDGRYLPLAGGVMSERLQVEKNTVDAGFGTGHVELRTTNGSAVAVGFHRSGFSALTLRHAIPGALDLVDHGGAWAQYRGGSFVAAGNRYYGGDGAFIDLTNGAAQFLTSGGGALQGRFASLLLGNDYAQAANVPAYGLYVTGATSLAGLTTRGLLTVNASMRFANGGVLQAQRADGTVDPVFWPRFTDDNTYLNYGAGGYFYIRDNANNTRLTIGPAAAYFNSTVFVPGEYGMALKLGGAYEAAYSYISSTPNLHLDSKANQNIYLNFSSNRPVNIGSIDQSTYKLAVAGDALLRGGWFRNETAGTGLYSEALNRHLYAASDGNGSGWHMTGGAGESYLALRGLEPSSAVRGWLYADAGGGFGLLHSGRGWALRATSGETRLHQGVLDAGAVSEGWINFAHTQAPEANPGGVLRGLRWGNAVPTSYGIYKGAEQNYGGTGPFARLFMVWHTGMKFGTTPYYGGFRFYGDLDMTGSTNELFSIGKGDIHVRATNNVYAHDFVLT